MGLLFLKLDFGKALFLFLGGIGLHLFNLAGMVCDIIRKVLIHLLNLTRVVYNLTDKAVIYLFNLGKVVHNLRVGNTSRNPRVGSNLDGRQYFLQELPAVEQIFELDTWTMMTRDLFHNLDHPLFDIRASFVTFLNDRKKELPDRCAKWALPVCVVLMQLATEIRLAVDLVEFRNWDDRILKDALEALRYSIYDFLGPIAFLLRNYCNAKRDENYTGGVKVGASASLKTFGQVGNFCMKCMIDVELALMSLMLHLSRGQATQDGHEAHEQMKLAELKPLRLLRDLMATPVANKVPTATFTELVLQNQSIIQRRSIVTALDSTNLVPATNYISMLLSAQREKRSEYPIAAEAGIPRCLAIVVDRQTGIATTGATQPAYHPDFPWLDSMGKQIHRLRVGETFRQAVHLCSDNVAQLVQEGAAKAGRRKAEDLDEDLVGRIYSEYMAATKQAGDLSKLPRANSEDPMRRQKWYSRLMLSDRRNEGFEAIPGPENTIFSWAFDTTSFELKPPCLRCQRMFSQWVLYDAPDDIEGRRTALKDLRAHDALKYNEKKDTCTYCAETVAAAKMYLLRSGRLSLG